MLHRTLTLKKALVHENFLKIQFKIDKSKINQSNFYLKMRKVGSDIRKLN